MNQANNHSNTPLYVASSTGHTEIVTTLLAANADVNQTNNDGATPLVVACGNGHNEVITALLAANADVNHAESTQGGTALQLASAGGKAEIVRMLLAAHADTNHIAKNNCTALRLAQIHEHPEVIEILEEAQLLPSCRCAERVRGGSDKADCGRRWT